VAVGRGSYQGHVYVVWQDEQGRARPNRAPRISMVRSSDLGQSWSAPRILLDSFEMPADGWYQLAPVGEFPHAACGVVQVVDRDACDAMANKFKAEAAVENFAGLLVDFDHFSLDGEKRSEAAGWITDLAMRNAECRTVCAGCSVQSNPLRDRIKEGIIK